MVKIDHRRHYIMVLDTETANTFTDETGRLDTSSTLVYDVGYAIVDIHGNIYKTASFVNRDIFTDCADLMQSAYYASKLPQYRADLAAGSRKMASTFEIRRAIVDDLREWGIKEVAAHNARFDYNSLNTLQRYVTKSKYRYFMPFGIEWLDTLKMARSVIGKMPSFIRWANENAYLNALGLPSFSAENLYRFISGNEDFEEAHTGLEDVLIEAQILAYCYKQKKQMEKYLFPLREVEPPTDFQRAFSASLREVPTIRMM